MFKISPINDKKQQELFSSVCGIKFCPELFAYSMIDQDSGELMGMSQFDILKDEGYIQALKPRVGYSDFEAMFILGRATMNFIDLMGAHACRADIDTADERLLRALGFKPDGDGFSADMTDMFNGHCDGHSVKLDS